MFFLRPRQKIKLRLPSATAVKVFLIPPLCVASFQFASRRPLFFWIELVPSNLCLIGDLAPSLSEFSFKRRSDVFPAGVQRELPASLPFSRIRTGQAPPLSKVPDSGCFLFQLSFPPNGYLLLVFFRTSSVVCSFLIRRNSSKAFLFSRFFFLYFFMMPLVHDCYWFSDHSS